MHEDREDQAFKTYTMSVLFCQIRQKCCNEWGFVNIVTIITEHNFTLRDGKRFCPAQFMRESIILPGGPKSQAGS